MTNSSELMTAKQRAQDSQPLLSGEHSGATGQRSWSQWRLLGFRFLSSYLLLSWLTVYGVLQVIPFIGFSLEGKIEKLWGIPVRWLGIHVFHLTGIASQFHPSDSRDTALSWITAASVVFASLLITGIWSFLDRRRRNYQILSCWLRYVLRLALIFLLLRYALMKIFPLQMAPPSLAVLNEPLGSTSPMTLLWTAIALHPQYEMLAGWIEAVTAVLLVFRRTALAGGLLAVVVMSNVLLYNFFFDVPVKLGALNVLTLAIAVVAPDLIMLWRFFILHRPSLLRSAWAPPMKSTTGNLALLIGEWAFVACALFQFLPGDFAGYREMRAQLKNPSTLAGVWHVDSILRNVNGKMIPASVLTGLGQPMTALILEPDGMAMARAQDGTLWRAQVSIDMTKQTISLGSGYFDGDRFEADYSITRPAVGRMTLTPLENFAATNGTMILSRIPLPEHYPLLEQKLHWVHEWAVER